MSRMSLKNTATEPYSAFVEVDKAIRSGPLAPPLRELVKIRVSQINRCIYCVDQHVREARGLGETEDRIHHLTVWPESPLFDDKEHLALSYAETVTRMDPVSDELWESLEKHFGAGELGHLVILVALINAFNRFGVPLRMKPASTPIAGAGS